MIAYVNYIIAFDNRMYQEGSGSDAKRNGLGYPPCRYDKTLSGGGKWGYSGV